MARMCRVALDATTRATQGKAKVAGGWTHHHINVKLAITGRANILHAPHETHPANLANRVSFAEVGTGDERFFSGIAPCPVLSIEAPRLA